MGMEYARLYFDFLDGEKGDFLREMCGDHGIVCLQRLWVKAGQRKNDGIFNKSPRALERIAKWTGDPDKFIDTLLDPDFPLLDKLDENKYRLHNWERNNPHLTEEAKKEREERARNAANTRWGNQDRREEVDEIINDLSESTSFPKC